jgi:hypothetical protein
VNLQNSMIFHLVFSFALAGVALAADAYQPRNSQAPGEEPPSAAALTEAWKLPEGFKVTLVAGEPQVRQPIDLKLDDRGRLWVAESYSYKEWKRTGEDRLVILEDADQDGVAEKRSVFPQTFHHLSSVALGFGGVWNK